MLTHPEGVLIAEEYLRRVCKCDPVLIEPKVCQEIPDVLGWSELGSFVVDWKCSSADLRADAQKPYRKRPSIGLGQFRIIMCETLVIEPYEVHPGWGLVVYDGGEFREMAKPERFRSWHIRGEIDIMRDTLRRMEQVHGRPDDARRLARGKAPNGQMAQIAEYVKQNPGTFAKHVAAQFLQPGQKKMTLIRQIVDESEKGVLFTGKGIPVHLFPVEEKTDGNKPVRV